jgi:hypothetical protein
LPCREAASKAKSALSGGSFDLIPTCDESVSAAPEFFELAFMRAFLLRKP